MNAELNIDEILTQVKKLNKVEQTTLLKKITSMLKKDAKSTKSMKLSDLSGLGASIWHNVDIDKYVENERQW
jgi:hypothetical protein